MQHIIMQFSLSSLSSTINRSFSFNGWEFHAHTKQQVKL